MGEQGCNGAQTTKCDKEVASNHCANSGTRVDFACPRFEDLQPGLDSPQGHGHGAVGSRGAAQAGEKCAGPGLQNLALRQQSVNPALPTTIGVGDWDLKGFHLFIFFFLSTTCGVFLMDKST